jgi:hypothetical protein
VQGTIVQPLYVIGSGHLTSSALDEARLEPLAGQTRKGQEQHDANDSEGGSGPHAVSPG